MTFPFLAPPVGTERPGATNEDQGARLWQPTIGAAG
jgi:hypothetical protein